MSDKIDTIAWVQSRGEPWHKKGTAVQNLMTSEEAIREGKLDWSIECRPIFTMIGNEKVQVPNKFATVRVDKGIPLGVVGKNYVPIQNRDAFTFFDNVLGNFGAKYEVVGSLGSGENVWMLVQLGDVIKIRKSDDVVRRYILLTNNHDGTRCFKMFITPIRVVCWNTLCAAMAGQKYDALGNVNDGISIRHTVNAADRIADAQKALGLATNFYDNLSTVFNKLAAKEISPQWMKDYTKALIGVPRKRPGKKEEFSSRAINTRNRIIDLMDHETNRLPGMRGTAWAAYNAVTLYADHFMKTSRISEGINKTKRLSDPDDRRLNNIWFGGGANLKIRALNTALEMVK
jgi:phage/plasmid-like protein (TIGR03299 family)